MSCSPNATCPPCIGWIGLAWLAPVWGALLYLMFGINRVVRRARQVRRPGLAPRSKPGRQAVGVHLPGFDFAGHLKPFERAVKRITHRPALAGNAAMLLGNGDEAFPAMLAAIDGAQGSIALSTYIMRDDAVGRRFVERLAAAQKRGVEVRILLDGVGSGYFSGDLRRPATPRSAGRAVHAFRFALAHAFLESAQP